MSDFIKFNSQIVLPLGIIISGITIGIILELLAHRKLKRAISEEKRKRYDIIRKSLRGMLFLIFSIAGIYGAIHTVGLNKTTLGLLKKILHVI